MVGSMKACESFLSNFSAPGIILIKKEPQAASRQLKKHVTPKIAIFTLPSPMSHFVVFYFGEWHTFWMAPCIKESSTGNINRFNLARHAPAML